jgi:hypothetical protein
MVAVMVRMRLKMPFQMGAERNPRNRILLHDVLVDIPERQENRFPLALTLLDSRRRSDHPLPFRWDGERLYAPCLGFDEDRGGSRPIPQEQALQSLREPGEVPPRIFPDDLVGHLHRWEQANAFVYAEMAPKDRHRVREAVEGHVERLRKAAAGLCLHGGLVWRPTHEPVWELAAGHDALYAHASWLHQPRHMSSVYRADELERIRTIAGHVMIDSRARVDAVGSIEVHLPEALTRDCDAENLSDTICRFLSHEGGRQWSSLADRPEAQLVAYARLRDAFLAAVGASRVSDIAPDNNQVYPHRLESMDSDIPAAVMALVEAWSPDAEALKGALRRWDTRWYRPVRGQDDEPLPAVPGRR